MKNLLYTLLILVIAMLLSCTEKTTDKQTAELTQPQIATAEIVSTPVPDVTNQASSKNISVRGYIDVPPSNKAAISPYFGGFVKDIKVLPGQKVKKGDVLFVLENPEYLSIQQSYLESKEQLSYLQNDFERQRQLANENIASTKNAMKAESDYKVMLARYSSLKEQINLMGISLEQLESGKFTSTIAVRAPLTGTVNELMITNSAFADAQKIALDIINAEHIHLELDVFEHDALIVNVGQKIQFSIPELSNQLYEGEVYLVGNAIDPIKRTIKVHGHIHKESDANFIPGMYIDARILVD